MNLLKTCTLVLAAGSMFFMTSCDSNKGKSKDLAKQFLVALNDGDKAGIYDLYPTAKSYTNMEMVTEMAEGDLSVEKDKETGRYTVSIDNTRQQKLVFEADSLNGLTIVDSYGVLQLNEACSDLALKAGVPIKKLSDVEQAKLMDESSLFITYLKEQNPSAVYGTLSEEPGTYSCGVRSGSAYCVLNIGIKNNGTQTVAGSDYFLEVDVQRRSSSLGFANIRTADGVDIAPGERRTFVIDVPGMYKYARQHDLTWMCSIKFRNATAVDGLLKYGKFTGEEYAKFQEVKEGIEIRLNSAYVIALGEKVGHIDLYEETSEDSPVKGTAYYRQGLTIVDEDETDGWAKVYEWKDIDKYDFKGYVRRSDFEYNDRTELSVLYLSEGVISSEDGSEVPMYKDADETSKVVKKLKPKTKVMYAGEFEKSMNVIYESDGKGGYKVVGYIPWDNIQFEEGDMETP